MGTTTLLFVATAALSHCLSRAGVIKDDVGLQTSLVICPNPGSPSNVLQIDLEVNVPEESGVVEKTFTFPEAGFFSRGISCILIQDLATDGKGGSVTTIEGGLNAKRLTFKLRSLPGHGLNYKIQIYTS